MKLLLLLLILFIVGGIVLFIVYKIVSLALKKRWDELKILFKRIGIFIGVLFLLKLLISPYLATKQMDKIKNDLINGIIEREIKLRELDAEVQGKKFIQTEPFKQQLKKEKEKFYKYCDGFGVFGYRNEYCEMSGGFGFVLIGGTIGYKLEYHFDEESQDFFNQTQTYMFREKFSLTHTPRPNNFIDGLLGIYPKPITTWHERFWIEDPNEGKVKPLDIEDYILYPVKIVGYKSDYIFEVLAFDPSGHICGEQEVELESDTPFMKENLMFIKSYYRNENGNTYDTSPIGIKAYIKKENK